MPRSRQIRSSFSAGEFSPRLVGRVELERYREACETIENMLVQPQGGLTRRPGFRFIAPAKHPTDRVTMIPFVTHSDTSYMIEAGNGYMRFYKDRKQVMTHGTDAAITNGNFVNGLTGWTDLSSGTSTVVIANYNVEIDGSEGTEIGNMAGDGGLSAAFDGETRKLFRDCASTRGLTPENLGTVGKDWGSTRTITRAKVYGSSDVGFQSGGASLTFLLEGSTDNFKKSIVELDRVARRDANGLIVTLEPGVDVTTAYRYHRIRIFGGDAKLQIRVAQVVFYRQTTANRRATFTGATGNAWIEQAITVGASFQGRPHVIRFRVIAKPGMLARIRIGSASQGTDYLSQRGVSNGRHAIKFVPGDSPFYVGFIATPGNRFDLTDVEILAASQQPVPYEIETTYSAAELIAGAWAQANDVMWIAHRSEPPRKLIRRGDDEWSLETVPFVDGPYLDEDPDETRVITASAVSGTVTLTASGSLWRSTHNGALWRIGPTGGVPGHKTWESGMAFSNNAYCKYAGNVYQCATGGTTGNSPPVHERGSVSDGTVTWRFVNKGGWGWVRITAYTSGTQVTAEVKRELDSSVVSGGSSVWREGAFSPRQGYPDCVALADSRLWYAKGNRLYASRVGSFDDFTPEDLDDDAITLELAGQRMPEVEWIEGNAQGIFVGTTSGVFRVGVPGDDRPMAPDNIAARPLDGSPVAPTQPIRAGSALLFLSRSGQRLHEIGPNIETGGWRINDLTIIADHIMGDTGGVQLAYQRSPQPIIWALRRDGRMAACTYQREEGVVAWSRHITAGTISSIAVIPGLKDAQERDELWIAARRIVNGETVTYIEMFESDLRYGSLPTDTFLADAAISVDNPIDIKEIVFAGEYTRVETVEPHGFTELELVDIDEVEGVDAINGRRYRAVQVTPTTFHLFDPRSYTTIGFEGQDNVTNTGVARKVVTTIGGLSHLVGRTVAITADGALHPTRVVSPGGNINLQRPASRLIVGLPYTIRMKSLKIMEGGAVGPAVAARRKISHVRLGLIGTLDAVKVGASFESAETATVLVREAGDAMDRPPPLRQVEALVSFPQGWHDDPRVCIQSADPMPFTLTHFVIDDVDTNELR